LIDDKPRLLIDDRKINVAFINNVHLRKLRETYHVPVQLIQDRDQMTLACA
jgi:hypothetical protein